MKCGITTIILDVDGTLTDDVSWLPLTAGLGADPKIHEKIFDDFKAGKHSYSDAKKQLIKLWQNTGNANKGFMKSMFQSWKLKCDTRETIDYLKKSYRLCLISGAVDLYIKIVAKKLGISDWYANTELIWDNKGNLVDFNYFADQAQKKLEQFNKFAKKYNLDKEECVIVGDGDSDLVLFRELKHGIAVNKDPNPDLESLSSKRISKLIELKNLL